MRMRNATAKCPAVLNAGRTHSRMARQQANRSHYRLVQEDSLCGDSAMLDAG
jgi:hypothetical protein